MRKHTEQFKLEVVQYYLGGAAGCKDTGKRYGVQGSLVRRWTAYYRAHGLEGLKPKAFSTYSAEFKLSVLQQVWENGLSYSRAAAMFDVRSQCLVAEWDRAYRAGGVEALTHRTRGRPTAMRAPTTRPEPPEIPPSEDDVSDALLTRDQLIAKLQYMRMEVAVLKKLEALAQSKAKSAMPKNRKSSTS